MRIPTHIWKWGIVLIFIIWNTCTLVVLVKIHEDYQAKLKSQDDKLKALIIRLGRVEKIINEIGYSRYRRIEMKTTIKRSINRIHEKVEEEDRRRLMRLKEAKDNKDIKKVVEMWSEEKLRPKILSDKQRTAIYLMTDFIHNFSNSYICERVQITKEELYKWRNDPVFLRELDKEITRRRSFIRIHAFRNVHRAILRGDMKSTWNYLKMSGDLKENINVTDSTGEQELSDGELNEEIVRLTKQLANSTQPQEN